MKKVIIILTLLLSFNSKAQSKIGIGVAIPLTDLHVNGNIQIAKDIKVGGSATVLGNSGVQGQFLRSNGDGNAPEWVSLRIPVVPAGSFSMTKSAVYIDKVGLELTEGASKRKYVENELITDVPENDPAAQWHPFPQLTTNIIIDKAVNKLNFILQSMVHVILEPDEATYSYAIGIFIDGRLKSVKPFMVKGKGSTFEVVTLIATIENVPLGHHTVKIAVIPRVKGSDGALAIGRPNRDGNNISAFMAQTSLKIDIFEVLN